ncbi:hypothetical protein PACTADRAFT_35621 [Pachysolen tannophilus NRRL Y-2460]|uniref:Uncharacterized protein n=1 Tax=Pachysolen tannophilus NRRL Y-2460 TaxID=669874 RepID=A0A1E4TQ37_PACTA|nr:hypothetical protein PACTADRAFT_35621 [Pachysolen tannophilus NRRL Y-2460]
MSRYSNSGYADESDRITCTFYNKIGACRHGDRCSRKHIRPTQSNVIMCPNLYLNPKFELFEEARYKELESQRENQRQINGNGKLQDGEENSVQQTGIGSSGITEDNLTQSNSSSATPVSFSTPPSIPPSIPSMPPVSTISTTSNNTQQTEEEEEQQQQSIDEKKFKETYFHSDTRSLHELTEEDIQKQFDDFYKDIFLECALKYGYIEDMVVCENFNHLNGNVYIKFSNQEDAYRAADDLNKRWYNQRPIFAELTPVKDFSEATCSDHCIRGTKCNFWHLKKTSQGLKKTLFLSQKKYHHNKATNNHITPKQTVYESFLFKTNRYL